MIGGLHPTSLRGAVPSIGPSVPTAIVHVVFLAVATALCVLVLDAPFWRGIGLLLAIAGTFIPNLVPRWWVILVLGVCQFWREPSVTDPTFYLLLAGVHLLHIIDSLCRQMPWNARVQTAAFVRPLQRFVSVQLLVQAVAVGALMAFSERRGTVPGLSILSVALLGVVGVVLVRGLQRGRG